MKRTRWIPWVLLCAVPGVFIWMTAGCGAACDTNADCMLTCDCDGDDEHEWVLYHECDNGFCGSQYTADLNKGCDVLCEE